MKYSQQRGQALTEYLIGLAGFVIVAACGARLFHDALENQWATLTAWLIYPNP